MNSVAISQVQTAPHLFLLTLVLCLGCSARTRTAGQVEPDRARDALLSVLDAWKSGEPIEVTETWETPIVTQDMKWKDGVELLSYEIVEEPIALDANLHCKVRLQLKADDGKTSSEVTEYIVGTDPVLTVFRKVF